jgi:hypothetical protein
MFLAAIREAQSKCNWTSIDFKGAEEQFDELATGR